MAKIYRNKAANRLRITRFGGVDLSTLTTETDLRRSPDARNMIADEHFFPVKRAGYKLIFTAEGAEKVHALHRFEGSPDAILAHIGTTLHKLTCTEDDWQSEVIATNLADAPSHSFMWAEKLYLLDGENYRVYDGQTLTPVRENAYVPTTSIGRTPAGEGTPLESPNLLTGRMSNTFCGDGTSKTYKLSRAPIADGSVTAQVSGSETTAFTVDAAAGTVTFTSAPADGAGIDNVAITFTAQNVRNEDIDKCRFASFFGGTNDTRVFVSGNPQKPNADFMSGLYDPTYFPEDGYTKIGGEGSAICGYARQYDSQIIIKTGQDGDAALYLRTFALDEQSRPLYAVSQGVSGAGAVGNSTIAALGDTPLYLSQEGVLALRGTNVALQRNVQNCSALINRHLLENDLTDACACAFAGRYYLRAGRYVYVADSAQTYYDASGNLQYEWYLWDDIPASCFLPMNGQLFFGTADGCVMRMLSRSEPGCYHDNGAPYTARWSLPLMDFDHSLVTKNVNSVGLMLQSYSRASHKIYVRADSNEREMVLAGSMSLLDFDDMHFDDFSFMTKSTPEMLRIRMKLRKVRLFTLTVENDTSDAMGLLGLEILWHPSAPVR